jgi:heptosyltransferase-2
MLKGLGLDPPSPVPPKLVVTEEERRTAGKHLRAVPAPRVVLHPGGFAARRWRTEQYWKLAEALRGCGFGIVFTGSAPEAEHFFRVLSVKSPLPEGMVSLMGATLRESMAVIAESNAVVSGATGPAHIAAACGVPNISLLILDETTFRRDGNRWEQVSSCAQKCRLVKSVSTEAVLIGIVWTGSPSILSFST